MKRAYLKKKHRKDKKESYRAKRIAATKAELAARQKLNLVDPLMPPSFELFVLPTPYTTLEQGMRAAAKEKGASRARSGGRDVARASY
jgi:hypothetical protein